MCSFIKTTKVAENHMVQRLVLNFKSVRETLRKKLRRVLRVDVNCIDEGFEMSECDEIIGRMEDDKA